MTSLVGRLYRFLIRLFYRRQRPFRSVLATELPERLKKSDLYLVGENSHFWFVAMICPCGCGDTLQMNLDERLRPRWTLSVDADGIPSLRPSVFRTVGCRSHFFITSGQIIWCKMDWRSDA